MLRQKYSPTQYIVIFSERYVQHDLYGPFTSIHIVF